MYEITIGSQLWACAYRRTHKSRVKAFRAAASDVAKIPDASIRPSQADLDSAYASLAAWDRSMRGKSPRMSHEPGNRTWFMDIVRV